VPYVDVGNQPPGLSLTAQGALSLRT
jgi:hypothetical protein